MRHVLKITSVLAVLAVAVMFCLSTLPVADGPPVLVAHWPLNEGEGGVFENLTDPAFDGFLSRYESLLIFPI